MAHLVPVYINKISSVYMSRSFFCKTPLIIYLLQFDNNDSPLVNWADCNLSSVVSSAEYNKTATYFRSFIQFYFDANL